ncbi:hypothetical protein F2P45_19245 [Massilia sp. CCM 8733]|uniref:Uncharacterized protein n=1 Tax=Massilia mucilaginosa TaxID=2609282 RepID=A0ABX0NWA4_9BURK|nr:hypothetical protein [Massilia mucilaginosa]NHZ91135.1 hypothetical protein [Massilia mucilaginosa]
MRKLNVLAGTAGSRLAAPLPGSRASLALEQFLDFKHACTATAQSIERLGPAQRRAPSAVKAWT